MNVDNFIDLVSDEEPEVQVEEEEQSEEMPVGRQQQQRINWETKVQPAFGATPNEEFILSRMQAAEFLHYLFMAAVLVELDDASKPDDLLRLAAIEPPTAPQNLDADANYEYLGDCMVRLVPNTLRTPPMVPRRAPDTPADRWIPSDEGQLGVTLTATFEVVKADDPELLWPVAIQRRGARRIPWYWFNPATQTTLSPNDPAIPRLTTGGGAVESTSDSSTIEDVFAEPVVFSDALNHLRVGDRFEMSTRDMRRTVRTDPNAIMFWDDAHLPSTPFIATIKTFVPQIEANFYATRSMSNSVKAASISYIRVGTPSIGQYRGDAAIFTLRKQMRTRRVLETVWKRVIQERRIAEMFDLREESDI